MQQVGTLKSWIDAKASPFAWQRIVLKLLPDFKKEGFFLHTIKEESNISRSLADKIRDTLFEMYKLTIPNELLQNNSTSLEN